MQLFNSKRTSRRSPMLSMTLLALVTVVGIMAQQVGMEIPSDFSGPLVKMWQQLREKLQLVSQDREINSIESSSQEFELANGQFHWQQTTNSSMGTYSQDQMTSEVNRRELAGLTETTEQNLKNLESFKENIRNNQNLKRNLKFQTPPPDVVLLTESIDPILTQIDEQSFVPTIGILTQPVSQGKKDKFNYHDYILEVNENFVKWAGSKTIAIPFDVSEEELTRILNQINGVLLTGGALSLIDEHGNQHQYYKTAKRIIEYSKEKKDKYDEDWPILGICQGLEVISIYQAGDDITALDKIVIYGENRAINWTISESRFFSDFPQHLRNKMQHDGLMLHAHTYSTSVETFMNRDGLRDEMIVTQTDIWHDEKNVSKSQESDVEFISAMEHWHYPFFASMYHPEYQLLEFTNEKRWNTINSSTTDEIAYRFSQKLHEMAKLNSNKIVSNSAQTDDENNINLTKSPSPDVETFTITNAISRVPSKSYPMIGGIEVYAYGYK